MHYLSFYFVFVNKREPNKSITNIGSKYTLKNQNNFILFAKYFAQFNFHLNMNLMLRIKPNNVKCKEITNREEEKKTKQI